MSIDKIYGPKKGRVITGDMNVEKFIYTVGHAGKEFFNNLREGRIVAALCKKCNIRYLPPRKYCIECFEEISDFIPVERFGIVWSYTIQHVDKDGVQLDKPIIWAIIKFDGIRGGILHKLGDISADDIVPGLLVEPVFKPKRKREGKITDILYFKPVEE
jgi:hypothetical protein